MAVVLPPAAPFGFTATIREIFCILVFCACGTRMANLMTVNGITSTVLFILINNKDIRGMASTGARIRQ